eukprot:4471675-Pleurochrysis_carterae.AAC.1
MSSSPPQRCLTHRTHHNIATSASKHDTYRAWSLLSRAHALRHAHRTNATPKHVAKAMETSHMDEKFAQKITAHAPCIRKTCTRRDSHRTRCNETIPLSSGRVSVGQQTARHELLLQAAAHAR